MTRRNSLAWNRNFQDILDLPDDAVRVGLPFADYIRGLAESGEYGPDANADEQIARLTALLGQANRFRAHPPERPRHRHQAKSDPRRRLRHHLRRHHRAQTRRGGVARRA